MPFLPWDSLMLLCSFYARVDDGNLLIYPSTSVDVTVDTDTGYAAGPDSAHVTGHAINHANISTLLASNSIPEQLKMYRFNNHIASHLFCGTCATRIATVGDFGAKFATVNLRILDLSKAGLGATDLSEPSKVKYADGKNDFKTRVGEPFPGGCW